jgi:hypothetical protein
MGAEARAGDVIVPRGTRISAAQVAAAAACGAAQLRVFARPRVAIVATGDELVEVDQQPLIHQIRNSNSYSLAAQVLAAGAQPVRLPSRAMSAGILKPSSAPRSSRPAAALRRGFHGKVRSGGGGPALFGRRVLLYRRADPARQAGRLRKTCRSRTARFTFSDFPAILYLPWLRSRFLSSRCWARSAANPAADPVSRRLAWQATSRSRPA